MKKINNLIKAKKYSDAVPLLAQQCTKNPANIKNWELLGDAYEKLQQYSLAVESYLKALKIDALNTTILIRIGNILLLQKNYKDATQAFVTVANLEPDNSLVMLKLGECMEALSLHTEAIDCYNKAVSISPDEIKPYLKLGHILRATNQLDTATKIYKHALSINISNIEALMSLASCYIDFQMYNEAEVLFKHVIEISPKTYQAYCNLGDLYNTVHKIDEAIAILQIGLEIDPSFSPILHNLARAFHLKEEYKTAEKYFEKARTVNHGSFISDYGLISNYLKLGDIDKANILAEELFKQRPNDEKLICILADIFFLKKEYQKSHDFIVKHLENSNNQLPLYLELLKPCPYLGGCEETVRKIESLLSTEANKLQREELITSHFSLAKAYDHIKGFERAFYHYKQGNTLKGLRLNRQDLFKNIDLIIQKTEASFFKKYHTDHKKQSHTPIFIIGMPRSGSSLLEQILDSHPDIYGAGELDYISHFTQEIYCKNNNHTYYDFLTDEHLTKYSEYYLEKTRGLDSSSKYIVDKMPYNFIHVGLISLLFPNAIILHAKRNPVDTCLSCYFQDFSGVHHHCYDLSDIGYYYNQYLRLMDHWHKVLPGKIMDVKYEDLIADFEKISRNIISFCKADWNEKCLDFHKNKRIVKTASSDQVNKPIYTSSVERWRNYEKFIDPLLDELNSPT